MVLLLFLLLTVFILFINYMTLSIGFLRNYGQHEVCSTILSLLETKAIFFCAFHKEASTWYRIQSIHNPTHTQCYQVGSTQMQHRPQPFHLMANRVPNPRMTWSVHLSYSQDVHIQVRSQLNHTQYQHCVRYNPTERNRKRRFDFL